MTGVLCCRCAPLVAQREPYKTAWADKLNMASVINTLLTVYNAALDFVTLASVSVFVVFGVWALRRRFQRQEEWALRTQLIIMLAVMVFYLLEVPALRYVLHDNPVHFIFALLGLLVAGLALYGHIAVSVFSRLLVELLVPDNPAAAATPRTGPAEALERQQDWEGALHEYYILARIYPRNPMLCVRAANNLMRLDRSADAAAWFQRAIKYTDKPEDNLALVRRLCDAFETMNQPDKAAEALRSFADRFPQHDMAQSILAELEAGGNNGHAPACAPPSAVLVALDDAPLRADEE